MTGIAIVGLLYRLSDRLFKGVGWVSRSCLASTSSIPM